MPTTRKAHKIYHLYPHSLTIEPDEKIWKFVSKLYYRCECPSITDDNSITILSYTYKNLIKEQSSFFIKKHYYKDVLKIYFKTKAEAIHFKMKHG